VANPAIFENTGPSELEEEDDGGEFGTNWDHEPREEGDGERSSASVPHSHPHPHPNPHGHEHTRSHSHGSHIRPSTGQENTRCRKRPTDFDMDKVRSTLKQLVRDWSEEVRLIDTFYCMKERQATGPLGRLYWSTSRIYPCRRGTTSVSLSQVRDSVGSRMTSPSLVFPVKEMSFRTTCYLPLSLFLIGPNKFTNIQSTLMSTPSLTSPIAQRCSSVSKYPTSFQATSLQDLISHS
jgi:hypothetical protein